MEAKLIRLSLVLALSACAGEAAPAPSEPAATESAPSATEEAAPSGSATETAEQAEAGETGADGTRLFGTALSDRDLTPLAQIASSPDTYAGQVVKTEGEITQVCQRMGCWMEMQAEGAPAIRVPMAGHSFFLPRDVAGQHVVIEGEVAVRELSDAEREHLASEGAQAVASALQISATGVVLGES